MKQTIDTLDTLLKLEETPDNINKIKAFIKSIPERIEGDGGGLIKSDLFDNRTYVGLVATYGKLEFLKAVVELLPEQLWRHSEKHLTYQDHFKVLQTPLEVAISEKNLTMAKWILSRTEPGLLRANSEVPGAKPRDLQFYLDRASDSKNKEMIQAIEQTIKTEAAKSISLKTDAAVFGSTLVIINVFLHDIGYLNRYSAAAGFLCSTALTYLQHLGLKREKSKNDSPLAFEKSVQESYFFYTVICLGIGLYNANIGGAIQDLGICR